MITVAVCAQQQPAPGIKVNVDLVLVNATITCSGQICSRPGEGEFSVLGPGREDLKSIAAMVFFNVGNRLHSN
jgi:hypothetical protein